MKDVTASMIRLDQPLPRHRFHSFLDPCRSVPLDMRRPIPDDLAPDCSVSSSLLFRKEPEEEEEDEDDDKSEEDGDEDEGDGAGYSE